MSEENTVTILDLLNLSLGTPEIGAVNFNLLHRFLLELVKHFSLARKQIDITDDISIQSALEETRMLTGAKSQTHSLAYSNLSEQTDGKRMGEFRTRDSSTALGSGKHGDEIKSRNSGSALDKLDTSANGVQSKDSISEMITSNEGGMGQRSGGSEEPFQTKSGSGKSRTGETVESKEKSRNLQTKQSPDASDKDSSDEKAQFGPGLPHSRQSPGIKSREHSPQSTMRSLVGKSSVTKDSKRTSPASSKIDIRKRSFIEMVPGLYQLERKISILEAKFESLSSAPTNLELVQQARDLQSRDSSTTAAGDMWQAMNLVRRIEVTEGAIDGITAMLDDINEQLKKMKENYPEGKLQELSNQFKNLGKSNNMLAEVEGKLKNIVQKTDLKPYITVKKMNEMMDYKLKNYRQLSPTVPMSPRKTSSKLAETEITETSSEPAQISPAITRVQTAKTEVGNDEAGQTEMTRKQSNEGSRSEPTAETTLQTTKSQITTGETKASGEQAQAAKSATPNSDQADPGTAVTPFSEKEGSEQAEIDAMAYSEVESVDVASLKADERGEFEEGERRGSLTTEAFEELYTTMHDWCDFREEAAQKINNLEEHLLNTIDKNSLTHLKNELKSLAEIQSTLKNNQQQVKDELHKLAEMQSSPLHKPVASRHDLSQLETSLDGQLQALSKSLQEMKQNFFPFYEMQETVGGLKETEDHVKNDIKSIRKEIMKIMKQLDDEQEIRKSLASAVGRKHSFAFGDSEEFHNIRSSMLEMKNDIDKNNSAMSQIIDDQNKKQLHLEALYGHVNQLENVKADKQQINRDIEIKADRKDLEGKVSSDKFHNSLSSLDQSVQDLVEKLVGHEATLKQAINHITSDVNSKLDKMDMDTVKSYFEGKLKDLNSKVQKKPNEDKSQAAGSRCLLLQPANCISCDRPVHLYREGTKLPSLPLNRPLPRNKSNRPYMSFDLSDIRQKMYDVQNPRGKDQTESLGQARVQNELLKLGAIKEGDDFPEIANRPCGGNHTLTCPEKRTTIRVNKAYREDLHFIAQLSQKDLSIVDILGYDGHVYKGHVNQLPSIPEIPKNTMARRPTTGSGRPRTSSPI